MQLSCCWKDQRMNVKPEMANEQPETVQFVGRFVISSFPFPV